MYRLRLHGRGGQGIKTTARILGSAFFGAGFEVQDSPLYGAERRGAPMSAFVRAAREPVRERGLVTRPDLVVVADETLVSVPAANVLLGMTGHTVLLLRSAADAATWNARPALAGPVVTLGDDASFAGARCAGAAARLVGVISRERLAHALEEELTQFDRAQAKKSIEQALAAFDDAAPQAGIVREGVAIAAAGYAAPQWIDLPLESAALAAPDVFAAASSVEVRTGLWRSLRPEIDYARCNRCAWICSTLCPDSAIQVRADGNPEIDYDHCKGCLICVSVCPPHAIAALPEQRAAA